MLHLSDSGRVHASVTCDEVASEMARDVPAMQTLYLPNVSVHIPGNVFTAPLYVIVEKIQGIRLRVSGRRCILRVFMLTARLLATHQNHCDVCRVASGTSLRFWVGGWY